MVTFFSPSGYEIRKDDPIADYITYLPLDTRKNARRFLSLVRPSLVVFVRYEFWPNILNEVNHRGIPLAVISAHFRDGQFIFRPLGRFIRSILD